MNYEPVKWYYIIFAIILIYMSIAGITFRFRHPQATETECILNFHHAMLFKKMTMEEIRQ